MRPDIDYFGIVPAICAEGRLYQILVSNRVHGNNILGFLEEFVVGRCRPSNFRTVPENSATRCGSKTWAANVRMCIHSSNAQDKGPVQEHGTFGE